MQQQQHGSNPQVSPSAEFGREEACWDRVETVLQNLEDQQSLLTGMFADFVKEARQGSVPSSLLQAAMAQCQHNPSSPTHQHDQQHVYTHEQRSHAIKRTRATELPLTVTLEELFSGAVKRVPVHLRRHDARTGAAVTVMQQLQVCVQPGLHTGTRITLPGLGDLDCQGQQSDLTFVVQQQLHPAFRRLADDLYAIVDVPLVTALTGGPVQLKTLAGQLLQLPLADNTIITPNSQLVVRNQGMPVYGDATGRRGALHVRFRVCFPRQLTPQQQHMLREALSGTDEQQQQHLLSPQAAAVAASAAGMLPQPTADAPLLTAAPSTAAAYKQKQQQPDDQLGTVHSQSHQFAASLLPFHMRQQTAAGGAATSTSSSSSRTAAVAQTRALPSAFAPASLGSTAACSLASTSSAADAHMCMQSTGSSQVHHLQHHPM